MFEKILIAEDHEIANISVRTTIEEFQVGTADYVFYCDHALQRIQKALQVGQPYQLLITDLYFEEDHWKQSIANGEDLIRAVKALQPNLKVIVFSAESRPAVIDRLFKSLALDGYVRKGRRDAQSLKEAIQTVSKGDTFLSSELRQHVSHHNTYEFSNFDILILNLLSTGVRQKDIPLHLKQQQIQPAGLSSVEKRLNHMKEIFQFTKNEQLIAYCKDIGVI